MKMFERLKQSLIELAGKPAHSLGRWKRFLRFQINLWRYCARRLQDNNAMAMSAALSFRTIFALVPILILSFLLLKSIGVVSDSKHVLHQFLEQSGLTQIVYPERPEGAETGGPSSPGRSPTTPGQSPASSEAAEVTSVAQKIEATLDNFESQLTVGRLGPIGGILLVWTALTLLMTMERSLNRIFEAPRHRSLPRRIMLYWSVVTLGPLLLVAVSYAGDVALTAAGGLTFVPQMLGAAGWAFSVVAGVLFLGAVYALMPNTQVQWRAAVTGAALVFPIWLAARWGFALYVERVGIKSLYGAMALIPLFLLWLNLCWTIFLFGAQLVAALSNRSRMDGSIRSDRQIIGSWDLLAATLAIAQNNRAGGGPVPLREVASGLGLSEDTTERLLACLSTHGVVCRVVDEASRSYLLARPPEKIGASEILELGCPGPEADEARSAQVSEAVSRVRQRTSSSLEKVTIASLLAA